MSGLDADLLQALESPIEEVRRLSRVAHMLIAAIESGEPLTADQLQECARQLREVDARVVRMDELIRTLWQMRSKRADVQ